VDGMLAEKKGRKIVCIDIGVGVFGFFVIIASIFIY